MSKLLQELQDLLVIAIEQDKLAAAVLLESMIEARQTHPAFRVVT